MRTLTLDDWLRQHPHLEGLARLHERVEEGLHGLGGVIPPIPLASAPEALPFLPQQVLEAAFYTQVAELLGQLLAQLAHPSLPSEFNQHCQDSVQRLHEDPAAVKQFLHQEISGEALATNALDQGFFRFFLWMLLRHLLRPWRDLVQTRLEQGDAQWQEAHCPFCGHGPALALLRNSRGGRRRQLVCGACALTWAYQRTGCPYCGSKEEAQQLLELEDDAGFRLDLCTQCQGFLKTIIKAKQADVLLLDWTSLHGDALALAQGWQRRAASLYSL